MQAKESYWLKHLHWLGHDSYRIGEPMVIYIDPWHLPADSPLADVILVSHEHFDHCSPDEVEQLRKDNTRVFANPGAAAQLKGEAQVLTPGETVTIGELRIETLPAYNTNKDFHPRAAQHLGFILEAYGERLYFAGDADHIPEMSQVDCQVALLPVSGTYVMTAEEAAGAAADIGADISIPMHYDAGVVGTLEDARRFKQLTAGQVVILENEGLSAEERRA
jgi:L-ascorbate metabolism protein UlaG (beta-lactamase superfamily)